MPQEEKLKGKSMMKFAKNWKLCLLVFFQQKKDIIQYMLLLLRLENSGRTQRTTEDGSYMVVSDLIEHGLGCVVYT